jgi:hypothetical protein
MDAILSGLGLPNVQNHSLAALARAARVNLRRAPNVRDSAVCTRIWNPCAFPRVAPATPWAVSGPSWAIAKTCGNSSDFVVGAERIELSTNGLRYRLKEIMGHASIETTMRYVRFAGELSAGEIAALDLAV